MSGQKAITTLDLSEYGLKKVASGKVREIFEIDDQSLLFVATDRISAYDVILTNGIPSKGALLTQLSNHWFQLIATNLATLRTHLLSPSPPSTLPPQCQSLIATRSMHVRRLPIVPLESIVRGYITGSAWAEYKSKGTVHGMPMPRGLRESEKLPKAVWTPSTKVEAGEHDENISKARAEEIVGKEVAARIEEVSLKVYEMARDYAAERGIIIADTKFEFGLDPATNELVLVDEVLTPDSSRFWPADEYEVGKGQRSYDKQYLRDWLTSSGLKGKEGTAMPTEVAAETASKYREAYEKLTGKQWN